ncbi:MAG TPA: bifunctional oligoribonuclease/PAP phosphatase NrnA [bacterium]|nr:bifunctional oligoribonuclease/PAP phosphatase NrnA [bacterium]
MATKKAKKKNMFDAIKPVIAKAKTFVLTTHVNPDGDGLGSEAAMYLFLKSLKKSPRIINTSPIPKAFQYLNYGNIIETYEPAKHDKVIQKADVVMVLDISVSKRLDRMQEAVVQAPGATICIDHHLDNDGFADHLCIDEKAPATAELVYNFIRYFKGKPNFKMAQALYTSLLTDTGGFRFNSTRPETHHMAAELLAIGVKPNDIYSQIFEQGRMSSLKLLGRALDRMKSECAEGMHWTYLTKKDFQETGTTKNDTEGFVNYALSLENSMFGVFAYETDEGFIKFSLRSKGHVDTQAFSKCYGGGGHKNASGISLKEPFDATLKKMIPEMVKYYNETYGKK